MDKVTSAETKVSEMETTVEDLQWDIEKLRNREQKLNKHLAEAMEQVCLYYFFLSTRCQPMLLFISHLWVHSDEALSIEACQASCLINAHLSFTLVSYVSMEIEKKYYMCRETKM